MARIAPIAAIVERRLRPHLEPRARVLAAVSGGTDSTALALALAHLGMRAVIAHVDHGTSPASPLAAARVRALAVRLGLPHVERRLELAAHSEAALREARYAALRAMAAECGATIVCTAHTADDQIETVLLRIARGAGVRGLAGIPIARALAPGLRVVRPLLGVPRATLDEALAAAGETPCDDPTNRDPRYTRNRIRHAVLPVLRASAGPHFGRRLLRLAHSARRASDALDAQARAWLGAHGSWPTDWRLQLALTDDAPTHLVARALQLAHEQLRDLPPPHAWVARAAALAVQPAGTRATGPGMLLAERTRTGLLVVDPERAGAPAARPLDLSEQPGRFGTTEWRLQARPRVFGGAVPTERSRAVLAAPSGALRMRARRAGDRFQPLGQPASVELRRFLQARGVPRFDRDRLPLVVDAEDRILWVPGVEIAAASAVRAAGRPCCELRLTIG